MTQQELNEVVAKLDRRWATSQGPQSKEQQTIAKLEGQIKKLNQDNQVLAKELSRVLEEKNRLFDQLSETNEAIRRALVKYYEKETGKVLGHSTTR